MLFSLPKHYLDTDTALKVSQSVYCFTTSISHGVENYFPRLWGTGISDAIFWNYFLLRKRNCIFFHFRIPLKHPKEFGRSPQKSLSFFDILILINAEGFSMVCYRYTCYVQIEIFLSVLD